jgi:hypothetical protein
VNKSRIIIASVVAVVAVFGLYNVEIVFDQSVSNGSEITDPAVERAFEECYEKKDDEIHTVAFGAIDNPDVQKEFITSNRARARAECRERHPVVMIRREASTSNNFIDFTPRYW